MLSSEATKGKGPVAASGACVMRIDFDQPIGDPEALAADVRRALYAYQNVTVSVGPSALEVRIAVGPTLALKSALDYAANSIVRALGPLGLPGKMVRRDEKT